MPTRRGAGAPPDRPGPRASAGPLAGLTQAALRAAVPEAIFERGARYAADGAVETVALRGAALHAAVQGSEERPYRVAVRRVVRGRDAGALVAACTCPYMGSVRAAGPAAGIRERVGPQCLSIVDAFAAMARCGVS